MEENITKKNTIQEIRPLRNKSIYTEENITNKKTIHKTKPPRKKYIQTEEHQEASPFKKKKTISLHDLEGG